MNQPMTTTTFSTALVSDPNQRRDIILGVVEKYTFIEDYLLSPKLGTNEPISAFIKLMSTVLYLRQRIGFLVESDESFYHCIEYNDYTEFSNIDPDELYNLLITFVSFAVGYIKLCVEDEADRDQIMSTIEKYYYKNKDFV